MGFLVIVVLFWQSFTVRIIYKAFSLFAWRDRRRVARVRKLWWSALCLRGVNRADEVGRGHTAGRDGRTNDWWLQSKLSQWCSAKSRAAAAPLLPLGRSGGGRLSDADSCSAVARQDGDASVHASTFAVVWFEAEMIWTNATTNEHSLWNSNTISFFFTLR